MFEIHIFPGDPDRDPSHEGHMFSLLLSDGSYFKSDCGYIDIPAATVVAGHTAERLEAEIACRRS